MKRWIPVGVYPVLQYGAGITMPRVSKNGDGGMKEVLSDELWVLSFKKQYDK